MKARIRNLAKTFSFIASFAVFGCSSSMTVNVRHPGTLQSVMGIPVERRRPFTFPEKVFNPVGAFYFRTVVAEIGFTDSRGEITIVRGGPRNEYVFIPPHRQPLLVSLDGTSLLLTPAVHIPPSKAIAYTVEKNGGRWGFYAWERSIEYGRWRRK